VCHITPVKRIDCLVCHTIHGTKGQCKETVGYQAKESGPASELEWMGRWKP
jgi:hypothetical protein